MYRDGVQRPRYHQRVRSREKYSGRDSDSRSLLFFLLLFREVVLLGLTFYSSLWKAQDTHNFEYDANHETATWTHSNVLAVTHVADRNLESVAAGARIMIYLKSGIESHVLDFNFVVVRHDEPVGRSQGLLVKGGRSKRTFCLEIVRLTMQKFGHLRPKDPH